MLKVLLTAQRCGHAIHPLGLDFCGGGVLGELSKAQRHCKARFYLKMVNDSQELIGFVGKGHDFHAFRNHSWHCLRILLKSHRCLPSLDSSCLSVRKLCALSVLAYGPAMGLARSSKLWIRRARYCNFASLHARFRYLKKRRQYWSNLTRCDDSSASQLGWLQTMAWRCYHSL